MKEYVWAYKWFVGIEYIKQTQDGFDYSVI